MSTTRIYKGFYPLLANSHPSHLLSRQGAPISGSRYYPQLHERSGNNEGFSVAHSVAVDDGVVQVVTNSEEGHTEWIWFREDGQVAFTLDGWGSVHAALLAGLIYADKNT